MSITLATKPYEEVSLEVKRMMNNEDGIKEIFQNKDGRVDESEVVSLILYDKSPIGFLNLNPEATLKFLFLDMGIIEAYRNRGLGAEAIKYLLNNFKTDKYIIGETKKRNEAANRMPNNLGTLILSNDYLNYYLFPAERKQSLINDPEYKKLQLRVQNGYQDKKELV